MASRTETEQGKGAAKAETLSGETAVAVDPFVGRVLSHYQLEERLGAGGMGLLYRATDLKLGRSVAIKLLARHLVTDETAKARFVREARAASALDHPNIGTVYDIGEEEGEVFIVMALYEGETLRQRLEKGPLPVDEALAILRQVSLGLEAAHRAGIVHRDIKPGNVLITSAGAIKVLDFGLAKLVSDSQAQTVTQAGQAMGTLLYMSPEQLRGEPVDERSDLWSLGVLEYEALAGVSPFQADSSAATAIRILNEEPPPLTSIPGVPDWLGELVAQLLRKKSTERPQRARDVLERVESATSSPMVPFARTLQRPAVFIGVVLFLAIAAVASGLSYRRYTRVRWAREEALPEIAALVDRARYPEAFALAERVEQIIPRDPALAKLFNEISRTLPIETTPEGAEVFLAAYESGEFRYLGRSPLSARVPFGRSPVSALVFFGPYRWRLVKEGFVPVEALTSNGRTGESPTASTQMRFVLDKEADLPKGMARVPGGLPLLGLQVPGYEHLPPLELPDYFIDRFEVTNRQFKQFVDQGGYRRRELWKEPFLDGDRALSWEEAIGRFRDRTGRPGPATWQSSDYPEGQDDFPVTGVSWYEAAAYAAFAGKSLPTVHHWSRAAGAWASHAIIPASNFGGAGLARVGSHREIGPYGTHDMAGNAKEWCWNASGAKRFILGGAWNEPSYMFTNLDAQDPFDRAPTHGFRLVKYLEEEKIPEAVKGPLAAVHARDLANEKPVPDAIFEVYRSLYAYDRSDLKASVDAVDDSSDRYRKEKVSFAAAYGNERVIAYVYTPKNVRPPWQPVVCFPGANAVRERLSEHLHMRFFSFALKSGRAVVLPIYKSTYERGDTLKSVAPAQTRFYRDHVIQWSNDLARALDYIQSRADFDHRAVGYLGLSWGAAVAPILLAVEPRIRAAVLVAGGFYSQRTLPEVDLLNFAPRARQPMLLVSGRHDFIFPVESSQAPFFRLLGAPAQEKRHLVLEAGHVPPYDRSMKEMLDWLDRYLGPVP